MLEVDKRYTGLRRGEMQILDKMSEGRRSVGLMRDVELVYFWIAEATCHRLTFDCSSMVFGKCGGGYGVDRILHDGVRKGKNGNR